MQSNNIDVSDLFISLLTQFFAILLDLIHHKICTYVVYICISTKYPSQNAEMPIFDGWRDVRFYIA